MPKHAPGAVGKHETFSSRTSRGRTCARCRGSIPYTIALAKERKRERGRERERGGEIVVAKFEPVIFVQTFACTHCMLRSIGLQVLSCLRARWSAVVLQTVHGQLAMLASVGVLGTRNSRGRTSARLGGKHLHPSLGERKKDCGSHVGSSRECSRCQPRGLRHLNRGEK